MIVQMIGTLGEQHGQPAFADHQRHQHRGNAWIGMRIAPRRFDDRLRRPRKALLEARAQAIRRETLAGHRWQMGTRRDDRQ